MWFYKHCLNPHCKVWDISAPAHLTACVRIQMLLYLEEFRGLKVLYTCKGTICVYPGLDMRSSHHTIKSLTAQTSCCWYIIILIVSLLGYSYLEKAKKQFFTFILCPLHWYTIEFIIIQLCTKLCTVYNWWLQEKNHLLYIALKNLHTLSWACLYSFTFFSKTSS